MEKLRIREVAEAAEGTLLRGDPDDIVTGVSTDSREASAEDLFIPLIGENHDAHDFLPGAAANGCRSFLVSEPEKAPDAGNVILVSDTQHAMERLAKVYLANLGLRRIAVTGSVGKTTTRDMIYFICSEKGKTGRPVRNFNNTVGVPLTVFRFDRSFEAAVFEEGMDAPGMIHTESDIVRPEVAVITNIGISHMEKLGSRENILKAKLEITDFFDSRSVLVVNQANDMLQKAVYPPNVRHVIRVGYADTEGADVIVSNVRDRGLSGITFDLTMEGETRKIDLAVPGEHNAMNAALAIAACRAFLGITPEEAQRGLAKLDLTGKRLRIRSGNGITVIDDSYNAAPESMRSAIRTLEASEGARRIALLGGMNELGAGSEEAHREIGAYAAAHGTDLVIGVGEKARDIVDGARDAGADARWYETKEKLFEDLDGLIRQGDLVLVKGSNANRMDLAADRLLREEGQNE